MEIYPLSFVTKWAKLRANYPALEIGDNKISWQELNHLTNINAEKIIKKGIVKNDVIAVIANNSFEVVLLYLSALKIGAICAFIAPESSPIIFSKLKNLSARGYFLAAKILTKQEKNTLGEFGLINITISTNINNLVKRNKNINDYGKYSDIIFTSGSSGIPKAIVHSLANNYYSAKGLLTELKFSANHSWFLSLPIYHISGIAIIWRWLIVGAKLIISDNNLEKEITWRQSLSKATHASLVPTQLLKILTKNIPQQLQTILLGGAPLPQLIMEKFSQRGINIWAGYGLTEASSTVYLKKINEAVKPTIGNLLPYRKLIINSKKECEIGEILISGKVLAKGIWQKGKIKPFSLENINGEKYFATGDLACWDTIEENIEHKKNLSIKGRIDNQFICGGENVYCEEIENELLKIVGINFACVIPVADEYFGARAVALIDRKRELTTDEINLLQKNLPIYKQPIAYLNFPISFLPTNSANNHNIKIPRTKVLQWVYNNTDYRKP